MDKVFTPFVTSFLITIVATPLTIKLARRLDIVDNPLRPHPAHVQNRIVPKAGGIPIYLSIILSAFLFLPITKWLIGIALGGLVLLIVGLWDDLVNNLSPYPRLLMQFLAAGIVVATGVGITFTTNPFGGILRLDQLIWTVNFFGTHNIIVFADLFALLWIVWMMNMVNWSWGVDGQMPGVIAVSALTIGVLAFNLFLRGDANQLPIAQFSVITAASALGFLIFNWHPAKIFPGDSGSNILGFTIAVLCILTSAKLAAALIVLLVPSMDFFYTFFRRVASGQSPFHGDRKHLHHLLLQRGWSHRGISLFYFGSSILLGLAAANLGSREKLFTLVGVGTRVLGVILWLHLFYKRPKPL